MVAPHGPGAGMPRADGPDGSVSAVSRGHFEPRRGVDRDAGGKAAAASGLAVEDHLAAVGLDDPERDREPETEPGGVELERPGRMVVAPVAHHVVAAEHVGLLLARDPDAGVAHHG